MTRQRAGCLSIGVALVLGAGCALGSPNFTAEDREGAFLLTITTPRLVWAADQPIAISATFNYLGPGSVELAGPGPGPHVRFGVLELTGDRKMEPLWLLACQHWDMTNLPLAVPFAKAGGWSADAPDAAFYEAYFDDPEFRLPPGRWEVSAHAPFSLGDCGSGQDINLKATITLTVQ